MCDTCKFQARTAADNLAAANSARLAGHGRKAHGRDAGHKRKFAEDNQAENTQAAWNLVYNQTLNRLLKTCKN